MDARTTTDFLFKIISALGATTGSWALIRSYWLTRSKIVLSQKTPEWSAYHQQGGVGTLDITLLVTNHSSQGNAIVQWHAWLETTEGRLTKIDAIQGQSTNTKTHEVVNRFNVVPFNVPPHAAVDCLLTFFNIKQSDFKQPFQLTVEATDMYGRKWKCVCVHPPNQVNG